MLTTAIKYYVMVNLLLLIENHNFKKLISATCFFIYKTCTTMEKLRTYESDVAITTPKNIMS